MSIVTRSRRIFSIVLKSNKNPRLYLSVAANGPKEPIVSSSILVDQATSSTLPPPPPSEGPSVAGAGRQPLSFLKYTLIAAVTGGVATAGYATYGRWFSTHVNLRNCHNE